MIWHQNGTEPLIDTDLETHQEIREHISIYRYIDIYIARNISFIFFSSSSNSRSIIQNTGTQLKYYIMCMCVSGGGKGAGVVRAEQGYPYAFDNA